MATSSPVFKGFSKAEFKKFLQGIGLGVIAKDYLLFEAMRDTINSKISFDDTIYQNMLEYLRLPTSEQKLDAAQNMPDNPNRQDSLITGLLKSELRKIAGVIHDGLEMGKNPKEIKKNLDTVKDLDAQRASRLLKYEQYLRAKGLEEEDVQKRLGLYFKRLLENRKETIARTEMAFAQGEGSHKNAQEMGKRWKMWMTVKDDRVSDVCAGNEAVGWIDIDKLFPSGHTCVPAHPNCRCAVAYKKLDPDVDDLQFAQERIEKTKKARGEVDI